MSHTSPRQTSANADFEINRSIVHLLHRAGQCTGESFAKHLAHRDLTPRQFAVMIAVAARDGATQINITEDTGIDRSTMVDVVRRLMKRGLLQRRRSRSDARSYVVRLTDAGHATIDAAIPEAAAVDQSILARISVADREAVLRGLRAIVREMADHRETT